MPESVDRHGERIARVEERVAGHDEDILGIRVRLDGPPRNDSISGRLHKLENDTVAARAAEAALSAIRSVQAQRDENAQKKDDFRFTKRTVLIGIFLSLIVFLQPWIVHWTLHHG